MGRARQQRRAQEKALQEALAQALQTGFDAGRQRAFEETLLATASTTLGREVADVASLVASEGVEDALRLAGTAAREVWPTRWRDALSGPISAVMQAATEQAAPVFGSFTLQNPRMASYLDGYTSQLADTLSETSYGNFEKTLREAMEEGLSVPDAAARLRERMPEINASRAELIARNETITASNGASYEQARTSGVVKGKRRLSAGDSRVRPEHRLIHGEERGIDEPYSNGEIFAGSNSVQCRCVDEWIVDFEALRGGAA